MGQSNTAKLGCSKGCFGLVLPKEFVNDISCVTLLYYVLFLILKVHAVICCYSCYNLCLSKYKPYRAYDINLFYSTINKVCLSICLTYEVKIINTSVSGTYGLMLYLYETNMQISLRRGVLHHSEYCQNSGFQWKRYSVSFLTQVATPCVTKIIPLCDINLTETVDMNAYEKYQFSEYLAYLVKSYDNTDRIC